MTPKQRRVLLDAVNFYRDWDLVGADEFAEAVLVALAEIAEHRQFRKERSQRR